MEPGDITNVVFKGNADVNDWFEVEMYVHVGEPNEVKFRIDILERNYYIIKDQNH